MKNLKIFFITIFSLIFLIACEKKKQVVQLK